MQRMCVVMFFTPDTEQKRALPAVCASLCTQKQKERRKEMILFLLFMLPLLWSHLRFVQHPHACCYWLQLFLHHYDWILSTLDIQFLSGHLR